MLNTAPVYGDPSHLGCTKLFVRFKETKLQDQVHWVSDSLGAALILVNYLPMESVYTVTYVNPDNVILKRIAYAREAVVEVMMEESVCRIVPAIKPPSPLKAV